MAGGTRPLWGWHQLRRRWARSLVTHAAVRPGELVLDVGAGLGVLTDALLDAGARVVAVELHRGRARILHHRYGPGSVVVVQADAADLRLPRRPFRVVANPPFAAVDPLLARLLSPGSRLQAAHVVVARHVAHRWCGPGAPGARRWAATFEVSVAWTVPRKAFVPPAPRDAKVLVIRRRGGGLSGLRRSGPRPARSGR